MDRRRQIAVAGALALAATTASTPPAEACLWIMGTSIDGEDKKVAGDHFHDVIIALTNHSRHQERATAPLGPTPPDDAPWNARSDHAALLVYRGRAQEAIDILESIEKQHPGEYVVAANLGTAYELAGKNEDARRWILEGIRRNPDSHEGTEWLHVRILDAKIALAADPDWLLTHSVLGLDFGDDPIPEKPERWPERQTFESTYKALQYQLHERMGFVKPPDPIVGELLGEFASLVAIRETVEQALPVFRLALAYEPVHDDTIRGRRDALLDLVEERLFWNTVQLWSLIIGIPLLIVALVVLIVWRRRKRRRRRDLPTARVVAS